MANILPQKMSGIITINNLITEALTVIKKADNPTGEEELCLQDIDEANSKLRRAGEMVHAITPNLADMIEFVKYNVPEDYHYCINHAWSGIGDWQA